MRVVSENSEEDLARQDAEAQFGYALRDLTANLFRITRGAGKGYEVIPQLRQLSEAIAAFRDAFGHGPLSDLFNEALQVHDDLTDYSDDNFRFARIKQITVDGALQYAASRLLRQHAHASRGEQQMYDGMRHYVDYINENQRAVTASKASSRPAVISKPSRPKPK